MSQTLCRIDVLPAFALPIISTRNSICGIRRRGCWVSIRATALREAFIDSIPSWIDGSHGSPSLFIVDDRTSLRQVNVKSCIRNLPKQFASIIRSVELLVCFLHLALSHSLRYHRLRPEYTRRLHRTSGQPTTSAFYSSSCIAFPLLFASLSSQNPLESLQESACSLDMWHMPSDTISFPSPKAKVNK